MQWRMWTLALLGEEMLQLCHGFECGFSNKVQTMDLLWSRSSLETRTVMSEVFYRWCNSSVWGCMLER